MDFEKPKETEMLSIDIQHEGYSIQCYETTIEHAKHLGLICKKPLYLKSIVVHSEKRNQGNGKAILNLIEEFGLKNKCDLIFGHIPQEAEFNKDERATYFSDRELIKYWLHNNGYAINGDDFDFHKVLKIQKPLFYYGGIGFNNCSEIGTYEVKTELETKRFSKLSDAKFFYESLKGEKAIWNLDLNELVDAWYRK
jgi:hypothetical protein